MRNFYILLLLFLQLNTFANVSIISYGSSWKYLDDGSDQGTAWFGTSFNDAAWLSGNGQLGYGDGDESTILNAGCTPVNTCTTKFITSYFRKTFAIGTTSTFINYTLNVRRDDGVVIYLDGVEIYRNNMPGGTILFSTLASAACTDDGNTPQTTSLTLAQLPTGTHTIAAEIHQSAASSSDISFDLELIANENNASVSRGPYLNLATQQSVHIRWRTNIPANSVVNFGTVTGTLTSNVTDNTLVTEHDVLITGLTADTKYYYSIGNSNPSVQTHYSGNKYFFQTLPIKGSIKPFTFWAIGDCGNNSSNQINVRNAYMNYMGSKTADGMLLLGDNAYNAGYDAEYTTNFFPQYQDSVLRNVILWPAPGNHDYANNATRQNDHAIPYYDMFTLPAAGEAGGIASGTEAFYSFDYANVHFLALDSYGKEANAYRIWDTLGPQALWVKNDLAANTQTWTVAYWHHPPYTLGSHTSETETDLIAIRTNFIRILERMGVDLILCGHSHVYERSYLLNGHYGNEASFNLSTHAFNNASSAKYDGSTNSCPYLKNLPQKTGTVYVVAGSSGQLGGQAAGWPHNAMYYSNNAQGGGLIIDVNANRLDVKWLCNDGIVRDQFTMMKEVNKKSTYTIHLNDSLLLNSSWIGNYIWNDGSTSNPRKVSPDGIDTDTLTLTDAFNCLRDSFIITKTQLLPIELVDFRANLTDSGIVILTWQTQTEYASSYFGIEWSADGSHFQPIGIVDAKGNAQNPSNYYFYHLQPQSGINYYRLKMVSADSTFNYSNVLQVNLQHSPNVLPKKDIVYVNPNPATNGLFMLDYYTLENKNVDIKIYNTLGALVYSNQAFMQNGITSLPIDLSNQPSGLYLLKANDILYKMEK